MKIDNAAIIISVFGRCQAKSSYFPTKVATDKLRLSFHTWKRTLVAGHDATGRGTCDLMIIVRMARSDSDICASVAPFCGRFPFGG
jgi:hypothetical protein